MKMGLTVQDVAKRTGISSHTLRYYAREGLLSFVERDEQGRRIFKDEDFERLFIIMSLKRSGMTIGKIREFTELCDEGDSSIEARLNIIRDQQVKVEKKIAELQECLEVLEYKEWLYATALEAGSTSVHDTMPEEDIPEHIRALRERIRQATNDMETRYKAL